MNEPNFRNGNEQRTFSFTARDVVAIGFRHQRVLVLCFCGVVLGVLLSALVSAGEVPSRDETAGEARTRRSDCESGAERAHDVS